MSLPELFCYRVSLASLGSSSHWQPPRAASSPDSPLRDCVRASPARVIPSPNPPRVPSPDSEEATERSFYFRPVSRSPSRTRLRGRSSGSPPPSTITPPQSPPPPRSHRSPFQAAPCESHSPAGDLPSTEFHGILKHREGSLGHHSHPQSSEGASARQTSDPRTPKKSILKIDSVEDRGEQALMLTRSSLKKDVSYERQPSSSSSSPGCQTKPRLGSSSSSSEDITTRTPRTFSDVIIDPVPGQGRRSAPEVMFFCSEQNSFESSSDLISQKNNTG